MWCACPRPRPLSDLESRSGSAARPSPFLLDFGGRAIATASALAPVRLVFPNWPPDRFEWSSCCLPLDLPFRESPEVAPFRISHPSSLFLPPRSPACDCCCLSRWRALLPYFFSAICWRARWPLRFLRGCGSGRPDQLPGLFCWRWGEPESGSVSDPEI